MPTKKEDLPGTLKRSPAKAQRTYAETLDAAEEQYDSEARAHQTAWSAVKHSFEKVGDHWETKEEKGPSDEQSKQSSAAKRNSPKPTHGGVDVEGNTRKQLYERARKAGVDGRSRMTKSELADVLARKGG
jgi:cation transport regulator ChaB